MFLRPVGLISPLFCVSVPFVSFTLSFCGSFASRWSLFLLVELLTLVLVCLLAVIVFLPLTVWLFVGCLESFVIVLHLFLHFLSASGHFVQFCDSDIRTKKMAVKAKKVKLKETQNKIL